MHNQGFSMSIPGQYPKSVYISEDFMNINYIFPTAQLPVQKVISAMATTPDVTRIFIFGSALEPRHNPWSDIDVYVEGISSNKVPYDRLKTKRPLDIWCADMLGDDPSFLSEIKRNGVIVYERNLV